jgi:pimeloyl-ACP methyl ester carboxylesterase
VEISVTEIGANGWAFTTRSAGPDDGPLVILLHGFPQTSRCYSAELAALAESGYRAVAPDQRGYSPGARPSEVGAYQLDELVTDVVGLADACRAERFHLVGHDWGGMVAWYVAGQHPERVRTLTSISTPHPQALLAALEGGDPEQVERFSYFDLFRQPEVPEQLLLGEDGSGEGLRTLFADSGIESGAAQSYVETLRRPGALTAALNWYRANDMRALDDTGPITMPTMYVWSTDDIALGRWAAEATAGHVAGPYRFEVFEGVNHWIPDVGADRLNPLLLEHVGHDR